MDVTESSTPRETTKTAALLRHAARLSWRASPRHVATVLVLDVLSAGLTIAQLLLMRAVLVAVAHAASGHGRPLSTAAVPVCAIVVVGLATATTAAAREAATQVLAELVQREAVLSVASPASQLPLIQFDDALLFDRIRRAIGFGGFRAYQVVTTVSQMISSSVAAFGVAIAIVSLAPLTVLPMLLVVAPVSVVTARANRDYSRTIRGFTPVERMRDYFANLLTTRESAVEVRTLDLRGFALRRYDLAEREIIAETKAVLGRRFRRAATGAALGAAAVFVALAVLALQVSARDVALPAAITVVLGIIQLSNAIASLVDSAGMLHQNALFLSDLSAFEEMGQTGLSDHGAPHKPLEPMRSLEMSGVSFRYPGITRNALTDVSLTVRRGEVVAIVGENGSGKSTLAKLLAGLYEPATGKVEWNGSVVSSSARQGAPEIALLPQDFLRLWLTARENISVSAADRMTDESAIERIAAESGAQDLIERLPNQYDTILSREIGGVQLSVGQWQRIALARTAFRQSSLVILDEPTAALDPKAELEIYETARSLFRDAAIVLISHRFSTVAAADVIYVLDDGHIVEGGTHADLCAREGQYAKMYRTQARMLAGLNGFEQPRA